mgnify:FL=1
MSKFYYLKKVEDHKYGFVYTKDFETDGVLNDIEITQCVDFANRMAWGEGYHRGKRSGGIKERSEKEKFVNTLQGKMTECALHKYLQGYHLDTSGVDFSVFGKGKWDTVDLACNNNKIAVKSTKYFGQLLLLETKDWDENGNYIPNEDTNTGVYDEIVLMRIRPNIEDIIKRKPDFWQLDVAEQLEFLKSIKWEFEISGYITHEDLQYIIRNHYVIKQGDCLGKVKENYKGIVMDADNYYVQVTNMRKKEELLKRLVEYKK